MIDGGITTQEEIAHAAAERTLSQFLMDIFTLDLKDAQEDYPPEYRLGWNHCLDAIRVMLMERIEEEVGAQGTHDYPKESTSSMAPTTSLPDFCCRRGSG